MERSTNPSGHPFANLIIIGSGLAAVAISVLISFSMPAFSHIHPIAFVLWLTLATLSGILSLRISSGYVTLTNLLVMSGLLMFGLPATLWLIIVSEASSDLIRTWQAERLGLPRRTAARTLTITAANVATQIYSLLGGWLLFSLAGGRLPMSQFSISDGWPLALLFTGYFLANNFLFNFILHLETGEPIGRGLWRDWQLIVLLDWLPLPLSTVIADVYANLELPTFIGLSLYLLAGLAGLHWLNQAQVATERRVRELTILGDISQTIQSSLDLPELLEALHQQIGQLMDAENFYVALYDKEANYLIFPLVYEDGKRTNYGGRPFSNGMTEYIIRTKQAYLIGDDMAAVSQRLGVDLMAEPATSWLGVPMRSEDHMIGAMVVHHPTQRQIYTSDHLSLLNTIASQAAVAIRNAQLYSTMRHRATELATLNTVSTALGVSLDLKQVARIIVSSVGPVIGCQKAAFFLLDEAGTHLHLVEAHKLSPSYIQEAQQVAVSPGERGQVAHSKTPLIIPNISDSDIATLRHTAQTEGIQAMVEVPLISQRDIVGTLVVYYTQPHSFNQSELDLLSTFANQAAVAVANARLYTRIDQALARRVEELSVIEEIERELLATLDAKRIIERLLERAMEVTGAHHGVVILCDDSPTQAHLLAHRGYRADIITPLLNQPWRLDTGISGRVLRTGQTAHVPDIRSDPDYYQVVPEVQSELSAPIKREEQVMGVISLESDAPGAFDSAAVSFTEHLANQAALALSNARLYEEAQQRRDRLQAILNSAGEGVLVVDLDGRVIMANPMLESLWQVSRQAIEGQTLEELLGRPALKVAARLGLSPTGLSAAGPSAAGDQPPLKQLQQKIRDDYQLPPPSLRFIERTTTPVLDSDERLIGWVLTLRDTTQERELEHMREELTSMIVHDLRSPLSAISSGLSLLSDTVRGQAEAGSAQEIITLSQRSARRLLNLVESLLDLSRGQLQLKRSAVDLTAMVQTAMDTLAPLAAENNIELNVQVPPNLPQVDIDEEKITRVLTNLLDNALKFTPRGRKISIQMEVLTSGHKVRCAVRDEGPGIPAEYIERIFDRFVQIPHQQGRRRGTGLGLAFCKLAVEAHGERIWVESQAGQGSTFYFTLPVCPDTPAPTTLDTSNTEDAIVDFLAGFVETQNFASP